ncbi:MAG: efflux RND transporter periplasmic adaptor subunit [Saprospiraceae bacterium]
MIEISAFKFNNNNMKNTSKKGQFPKFPIILALVALGLFSCHSHEKEDHHDHGEEATTQEPDSKITSLSAEQMKSIQIELGTIEKKQLTSSMKANGILKVPNQNKANATAVLGGIIKSIQAQAGSTVRKGDLLATISNQAFITLQEDYLTVNSKLELAQLELNRQNELQTGNAGALKNYQAANAELKMLKTRRASLRKQLEAVGISVSNISNDNIQSTVSIRSPIQGTVSEVLVNIGSYVEANNPIVEIVDNSQLHLDLLVYEKDLPKIKVGQTIHFTLTNDPGKEYDADVYAISNTFEQNTKAISVHAKVKGNKQGLIDGMSITALVSLQNATVPAVPTNSIVNQDGIDYIFMVAKNDNSADSTKHTETAAGLTYFEKIPIRKGTTDVGYSEITLLQEIPSTAKSLPMVHFSS